MLTILLQFVFTAGLIRFVLWLLFDRPLQRQLREIDDRLRIAEALAALTDEEREERLREPFGRSEE